MTTETLFLGAARRVRVVRVDTRRRQRLARRLAAMGWCPWVIRRATLFTQCALIKVLAKPETAGLWGDVAAQIKREMERVS